MIVFFRKPVLTVLTAFALALSLSLSCGDTETASLSTIDTIAPAASHAILPHPAFAQVPGDVSISDVAEKCINSVVNISSTRVVRTSDDQNLSPFLSDPFLQRFFGPDFQQQIPQDRLEQSLGSGVIISADGIIVTNNHVVENADELRVTLFDNREFDAEIIGTDPPTDIAVIKLKGDDLTGLEPLPLGNSDNLRLGDVVLAIGNPFGLGHTVTMGIVSALGRSSVGIEDYENFIQTDAAINPGNSGGALINLRGELVGVNTAIASQTGGYQGVGFAIPSTMADEIAQKLITDGEIIRGWLGVGIQDITADIADAMGLSSTDGVLVSDVFEDGPAGEAGLEPGDIIVRVNGTAVTRVNQLQNMIAMLGADTDASLTILRDNRERTITVTLGTREEQPQVAQRQSGRRGTTPDDLTVGALNNQIRSQYNIPGNINGVIITDLASNGPAARAGLMQGDVIREVNRQPVNSVQTFTSLYNDATGNVLLYVYRQGNSIFLVVRK